jgi:hypothetical protein
VVAIASSAGGGGGVLGGGGGGLLGGGGGGLLGGGGGGLLGGGLVGLAPLAQVVPLSANDVGAALLPDQEPLKPNDTVPFDAMVVLYQTPVAVNWPPYWVIVELHA